MDIKDITFWDLPNAFAQAVKNFRRRHEATLEEQDGFMESLYKGLLNAGFSKSKDDSRHASDVITHFGISDCTPEGPVRKTPTCIFLIGKTSTEAIQHPPDPIFPKKYQYTGQFLAITPFIKNHELGILVRTNPSGYIDTESGFIGTSSKENTDKFFLWSKRERSIRKFLHQWIEANASPHIQNKVSLVENPANVVEGNFEQRKLG